MKSIFSSASYSLFLRLLGSGLQFLFSLLIARIYGAEGFGAYALALSFVVITSTLGRWGLDQASLKYISIFAEKGEWDNVRLIQSEAIKFVIIISFLLMLLMLVISFFFIGSFFEQPGLDELLFVLAFAVLPMSGLNLLSECLRAVKRIGIYTLIQSVLVAFFALIVFFLFDQLETGVIAAAYAYITACYVTFFVALAFWWRFMFLRSDEVGEQRNVNLLEAAYPMAWVAIAATFMSFSETIILGFFRSSEEVGIYSAALRLAMLTSFILIAFNSVLAPKIAALIDDKKVRIVEGLIRKTAVMMLLAALPLTILFLVYPENVLQLFGRDFAKGSLVLVILALAQLVNVATGPVSLLLMMGGHEKAMRSFSLSAWVIGLFAGLWLIPLYGAEGAAISALVGIVVLNFLALFGVKKLMHIHLFRLAR